MISLLATASVQRAGFMERFPPRHACEFRAASEWWLRRIALPRCGDVRLLPLSVSLVNDRTRIDCVLVLFYSN